MNSPDREKEFMMMYDRLSDRELARYFGVPVSQVQLMIEAIRNRVAAAAQRAEEKKQKQEQRKTRGKMPRWTEAEISTLRELYPHIPNKQVARSIGRSVTSVVCRAQRMGLRKTPERLREMGLENVRGRWDR